MDVLWSPWRMNYIQQQDKPDGCIFCNAANAAEDTPDNLVVARGERAFVILNRYPYTNGHLMVVPYVHEPSIETLDAETRGEMMEMVNQALSVLRLVYNPQAFNVGINIGEAAGAGVAEHVHIHVLPRWSGDTNFMTSVAATRIIPEELGQTFRRIHAAWNQPQNPS
ncbi:MAG: HIT domain-containing protein [Anaerolineaceae bacterium]